MPALFLVEGGRITWHFIPEQMGGRPRLARHPSPRNRPKRPEFSAKATETSAASTVRVGAAPGGHPGGRHFLGSDFGNWRDGEAHSPLSAR